MNLGSLSPAPGSVKKRKRVGRGQGSGHGGTSCRGHKGQRSRAGSKIRPWFEGGQMPLQRRLPKRGFTNIFKKTFQIVNVRDLARLEKTKDVTPASLYESGLVSKKNVPVKVLGDGELEKAVNITAHAFTASAKEKIEKAGGKVTIL
jgi:large subunit ribosomal protein L15